LIDSDLCNAEKEELTYSYYREFKKGKSPKNAPTYIDENKAKNQEKEVKMEKYYCPVCGFVYDPTVGDPDSGIKAGTAFEDIPENWMCPTCGMQKSDFVKVS